MYWFWLVGRGFLECHVSQMIYLLVSKCHDSLLMFAVVAVGGRWAHMFSCLVNMWLLSPCCVSGTLLITGDGGKKAKEWFCPQTCEEGSQVNSASVKCLEIGEVHSALGVHDWRNLKLKLIKWKLMCYLWKFYLWKLISTFMKIIVFYFWKLMCPGSHSQ